MDVEGSNLKEGGYQIHPCTKTLKEVRWEATEF